MAEQPASEQPASPLLTASTDGDEHGEAAEGSPQRTAAPGCWKCTAIAAVLVAVLAAAGAAAWSAAPATVRRGAGELLGPARHMLEPSGARAMTAPPQQPPARVPGGSGDQVEVQFYWLRNIARCVGVDGGLEAAKIGAGLVLTSCAEGPLGFAMPAPGDPFIRVAEKPNLCVDNPSNTSKLRLWNCSETDDAATNMQFFLQASSGNRTTGTVRALQNASMCVGGAVDRAGAPVEMHKCVAGAAGDLFMLNLVIEGSLLEAALEPSGRPKAEPSVIAEAEGAALSAWSQATDATQNAAGAAQRFAQDSLESVGRAGRGLPGASAMLWNTTRSRAKNWTGWWH